MLVQNFSHNAAVAFRPALKAKEEGAAFAPAAQNDLVEIGRGVNGQDRFINLGPIGKIVYGGAGAGLGAVGGGIAWAAGAPGWAMPAAAAAGALVGAIIGHVRVDT